MKSLRILLVFILMVGLSSNLKSQTSNLKSQTSNLNSQTSNLKSQTSNLKPQTSPLSSNWRDSLAMLNRMITAQPQSTDLRLKKAAVNIELQQWEYAVEEYGRVLELDDKNLSALFFRAYCYNHLRRYDMARADYERFLKIVPRHFDAQLGLAMTKRNLGKKLETQDELNRLVAMYPDSALAYAARANYEQEQKQYELALFDWDEALRLSPDHRDFLLAKYEVLLAMKRNDEARRLLKLIRQNP